MQSNELYPIFLKANQLNILIVGGGTVAAEKLGFLLKSSPHANVTMVASKFDPLVIEMIEQENVTRVLDKYSDRYLNEINITIAATNDTVVNKEIYFDCKQRGILVNVADTPKLCDFYLGGIVTKGNLKLAISTNGKSPTSAKRLRQFFENVLPDSVDDLVNNLHEYRQTLKSDFRTKVDTLNQLTKSLID